MSSPPNILHLFTDQQRFDTVGALGNPIIRTPNLDRLCESGVAFRSAYSPSPVCVAARCSMIFGQYPMHTGCYENQVMPTDGRETFMAALTRAGYRTHGIGKCHFMPEKLALRGFQSREVQEEGGAASLEGEHYLRYLHDKGYLHVGEPFGSRGEMYYTPQVSQLPAEHHPTGWVGERSLAFVRAQEAETRPWYLYSSFIHPHPPFAPPTPWNKLYRAPLMPLPKSIPDGESLLTYVNKCQNRYKYRDQGTDHNLARLTVAFYYACISFIDFQIGRILDALEETGQLGNTLILFSSDHGEHLGDNGCFGKRSMHDASARVPLIVSQQGRLEGGRVCDEPASLVDLAPTFLAAAGATADTHQLDGVDLAALASGEISRDAVFAQHCYAPSSNPLQNGQPPQHEYRDSAEERAAYSTYMAVTRDWKYFYSAPDQRAFLFDRWRDPQETKNLAGNILRRCEEEAMRALLMKHLGKGGETQAFSGDDWRRFPKPSIPENPLAGQLIQDSYTPWFETELKGYSREGGEGRTHGM